LLQCWLDGIDFSSKSKISFSSGGWNSFEHLLLTSSSAILFGISSGLDIKNTSTAASR